VWRSSYAEPFVRSIKSECVNKMIIFCESSLSRAIREHAAHYGRERNHQGLENTLIEVGDLPSVGDVQCRERPYPASLIRSHGSRWALVHESAPGARMVRLLSRRRGSVREGVWGSSEFLTDDTRGDRERV